MNAFMYYGPQIFEEIGISPFLFTAVVGLVNFGATLPAVCTQVTLLVLTWCTMKSKLMLSGLCF